MAKFKLINLKKLENKEQKRRAKVDENAVAFDARTTVWVVEADACQIMNGQDFKTYNLTGGIIEWDD